MSTPTDIERISYGGPKGSLQLGAHRQVIQGVGAARTLLAKESGALCLYDVSTPLVYTLPVPVEGMMFEFLTAVSVVASDTHKLITNSSSVFLLGAVIAISADVTGDAFAANGTNIVALTSNGGTTGGLIGQYLKVVAISATQWSIRGVQQGSQTLATPFATS
jgi:hypothetical protein